MKAKPVLAALILAVLALTSCAGEKPIKLEGAQPDAPVESNGGWAAKQGDWIYYINGDNYTRLQERYHPLRGALCRMKTDGTDTAVVISDDVSLFNILGEYIYYVAYEKGNSVSYRVKSDGTKKEKLAQFDSIYEGGGYAFCEDVIYYVKNSCLYRMSLDGKKQEKLTNYGVYNIRASKNYLYFTQSLSDDEISLGPLYRVSKTESEPLKLTNSAAYMLYAGEQTVYYYLLDSGYCYAMDEHTLQSWSIAHSGYQEYLFIEELGIALCSFTDDENSGIYSIPLQGGERQKIADDKAGRMLYYNGYVYYINMSDLYALYRMKPDGSEREAMTNDMISDLDDLDPVAGWIYYFSETDDGRIYRINTEDFYTECIEYEGIGSIGG